MNIKTHKIRVYPHNGVLDPAFPKQFYDTVNFQETYHVVEYALNYAEKCYEFRHSAKVMRWNAYLNLDLELFNLWVVESDEGGGADELYHCNLISGNSGWDQEPLYFQSDELVFIGEFDAFRDLVTQIFPDLKETEILSVDRQITIIPFEFRYRSNVHYETEITVNSELREVPPEYMQKEVKFSDLESEITSARPFHFLEAFYYWPHKVDDARFNESDEYELMRISPALEAIEFRYRGRTTHRFEWYEKFHPLQAHRWYHFGYDHWDNIASPQWLAFVENRQK